MTKEDKINLAEVLSFQFQNQLEVDDFLIGLGDHFGGKWTTGTRSTSGEIQVIYED